MTKYRCTNCPAKPVFLDLEGLKEHWSLTHTVPLEGPLSNHIGPIHPFLAAIISDQLNKPVKLYEIVEEVA